MPTEEMFRELDGELSLKDAAGVSSHELEREPHLKDAARVRLRVRAHVHEEINRNTSINVVVFYTATENTKTRISKCVFVPQNKYRRAQIPTWIVLHREEII